MAKKETTVKKPAAKKATAPAKKTTTKKVTAKKVAAKKVEKNVEIALKSSCPSLSCGRIDIGIDSLLCMVVSSQLNYTKGTASMPF